MIIRRPEITQERINEIQTLIADNPEMGRSDISRQICRMWEWQLPSGQLKDISARDMLRDLDKAGKICLPPPKLAIRQPGQKSRIKHLVHHMDPVECPLTELLPVRLDIVSTSAALEEFKSYIDQFHYLAFDRTVGENMKYVARDKHDVPLACLLYGSAAWSCGDRDRFIGWNKAQRTENLMWVTNHVRYLVLPWIHVPNLASYILALAARQISRDWQDKYGHGLLCLETYVESPRFRGTCYRAANWIYVGRTLGRGRDGGHHHAVMPEKDVYLYPLVKDFRKKLQNRLPWLQRNTNGCAGKRAKEDYHV